MITVPQCDEAMMELKECASSLVQAQPLDWPMGLYGAHQQYNAGLAVALVRAVQTDVSEQAIRDGLMHVNWPGRFEIVERRVPIILDGAHNSAGIAALTHALRSHPRFAQKQFIMIYGSLGGPNVEDKIKALKESDLELANIYLHAPNNSRAIPINDLRAA